jgi:hypothetical protein
VANTAFPKNALFVPNGAFGKYVVVDLTAFLLNHKRHKSSHNYSLNPFVFFCGSKNKFVVRKIKW